ncbi:MAG TPA: DUF58 domain-containing protein [Gemmataceae bacterium]|jgi:uncharacterized protein (DUF58 family)|nr:DUF58 domain-containing protein [Gemmataceae bacterium]
MLTARGWWFLLIVLALLALALLWPNEPVALLALTLGLWFLWQWLSFAVRARLVSRRLWVERQLHDDHGPVATLWAGRTFQVRVALRLSGGLSLPYVAVTDRVPFETELDAGEPRTEGAVAADQALELEYRLRCPAAGRVRFEGVGIQLADAQGLFYHATFVSGVALLRVLPPLADAEGHTATVKRHNLLPPPGIHRLRRPGSGSELLDLRDYLPGDPPKTIAWKVSARRDRLITKEFESEVPVRCTLFVDTSNSVRLGPPGKNALARLVEIAATVAQAAAGTRDLTGLCLFDEAGAEVIRPARGSRHLVHLLNALTEAAGLAPTTGHAKPHRLLPLAHAFAQEVYPELMSHDLNRVPFWLPWLAPQPAYTQREPTLDDRAYRFLPAFLVLYIFISLCVIGLGVAGITRWFLAGEPGPYLAWAVLGLVAFSLIVVLLVIPLKLFFPRHRRRYQWRKRLAALLSVQYGLAPGGLAVLMEDDEQFYRHVQRFLADHHVPYSLPFYDRRGRYLFAAPGKVDVLAGTLLRAVGKGHDNELFVLLADLLELTGHLEPLLGAVKVALSRHHRVMVICPWPPGVPLPGAGDDDDAEMGRHGDGRRARGVAEAVRRGTVRRFHRAFQQLRRTFARLRVPVICARRGDPARLIISRLDWLRGPGTRR